MPFALVMGLVTLAMSVWPTGLLTLHTRVPEDIWSMVPAATWLDAAAAGVLACCVTTGADVAAGAGDCTGACATRVGAGRRCALPAARDEDLSDCGSGVGATTVSWKVGSGARWVCASARSRARLESLAAVLLSCEQAT